MENNDKLIADLRNCANGGCRECSYRGDDCGCKLDIAAADALANAQTTIASDQRIIQSLRQSCDAFSQRNMELVAEVRELKAKLTLESIDNQLMKPRHGRWIYENDQILKPYCTVCLTNSPRKGYTPYYCPHCGAKMDEEDKI